SSTETRRTRNGPIPGRRRSRLPRGAACRWADSSCVGSRSSGSVPIAASPVRHTTSSGRDGIVLTTPDRGALSHNSGVVARVRDQFDLVAGLVLQVGGVVLGAAGVRVAVREQQRPAVFRGGRDDGVDVRARTGVEREMVDTGCEAVVGTG